jgi:hypothetical protein
MYKYWSDFWNDKATAALVLRTAAIGLCLYFFFDPQTFKQWAMMLLGAGSVLIPAGQPNNMENK